MAGICIQCAKCLKILSDSTALVLSDAAKNILAVKGASCVVVDEERIQDETDGGDSEYSRARCENCDALVGRLYNRVGEANARVRDLLCLDTAAVCSYQLGSHELKCAGHEQTPTISGGGGNGSQGGVSVDEDRVRRLEEQMVKARSSSHWSPYDGVGAVNADP
ncbi:uncharacterized protein MICPUCDRAFT_59416 [Micromonas pusilla CCMP1545]|uniref:Protein yippee-like n=1 Tax=Micromonas pusilla (strain CCMP1545) TaxID=564608 RepID=C1MVL0_MICPC|nr:uncharacterized protein MICPUCDRAFT_59416 [Micromonas pusilla CCMP1545]EEH55722.1 predicted protein [Micromonas pusilla CCMP1545]|eukprot:XP_003059770.1 predicted protein [Micromonas pusilla CCMP1545]